jgi:hypothetical protein
MKLPPQTPAVRRDAVPWPERPPAARAGHGVRPATMVGAECPPNSGGYCPDGQNYCCYNNMTRQYRCSSSAC